MSFSSRRDYERYVYSLADQNHRIRSSTLRLYSNSTTTGFLRGSVWLNNGLELRVFEYVDFSDGELLDYSYTVFRGADKIRWYDPQPHPENPELSATFPHHRHEPPDIKHNRRPAPGISFTEPNLATLIADCVALATD